MDDSRVVAEKAPSRWLRDSSEGAATSWWLRADGSSRGIALKRTARRRLRGDGSDVTAQGEWHRADVPLIIRRSLRSHNVYVCVRMGRCTNTWCSSTMTAPAVVDSVTASAGWCVGVLLGSGDWFVPQVVPLWAPVKLHHQYWCTTAPMTLTLTSYHLPLSSYLLFLTHCLLPLP